MSDIYSVTICEQRVMALSTSGLTEWQETGCHLFGSPTGAIRAAQSLLSACDIAEDSNGDALSPKDMRFHLGHWGSTSAYGIMGDKVVYYIEIDKTEVNPSVQPLRQHQAV
jgi:hypothetical protein